MRPNLNIDDVTDLYVQLLAHDARDIAGQIYNAGYQNLTVTDIAETARAGVQRELPDREHIEIETTPTDDTRSYHISSAKIARELGFNPKWTSEDAIKDLVVAFRGGRLPNPMDDMRYYNIMTMQHLGLQ